MRYVRIVGASVALIFTAATTHAEMFDTRPTEFYGSVEKQQSQHELATTYKIEFVRTDDQVRLEIEAGRLVSIEDTETYHLDKDLGRGYAQRPLLYYVRPWVRDWISEFAERFNIEFSEPIKITSLLRTEARQAQLQRFEPNAARNVPTAHLTGAALDISKLGLVRNQLRWMRKELAAMVSSGQIVVIEEMHILNFHIFVLPPSEEAAPTTSPALLPNDHDCVRHGLQ